MKTRKLLIPVVIIVAIILVLFTIIISIITTKDFSISTGRCLVTDKGAIMLIIDNSPIQMSNQTQIDLFKNLDTGDKILVLHDGIQESYPGKTGVYAIFKLEDGQSDDIPQTVINSLIDLKWIENKPQ